MGDSPVLPADALAAIARLALGEARDATGVVLLEVEAEDPDAVSAGLVYPLGARGLVYRYASIELSERLLDLADASAGGVDRPRAWTSLVMRIEPDGRFDARLGVGPLDPASSFGERRRQRVAAAFGDLPVDESEPEGSPD